MRQFWASLITLSPEPTASFFCRTCWANAPQYGIVTPAVYSSALETFTPRHISRVPLSKGYRWLFLALRNQWRIAGCQYKEYTQAEASQTRARGSRFSQTSLERNSTC